MNLQSTGMVSRSMPAKALLGDVGRLYDLARERDTGSRARLVDEISRLLMFGVTPRESELVADVLIELLTQAQKDIRCALAQKLAKIEDVPLRLALRLANDELDVAEPILKYSQALDEFDLMYIIKSKSAEYWEVIAQRHHLSAQVVELLADTGDFNTALALLQNKEIMLTEASLVGLSDVARGCDALALPLLRREEVNVELAQALYEYVGDQVQAFITQNFSGEQAQKASDAVTQVVSELAQEAESGITKINEALDRLPLPQEFVPENHMVEMAVSYRQQGLLTLPMMLETLRQNRLRSFVAMFSVYTDISLEMIGQVLLQTNGKSLSIICRAYGIEKQDFISIFMMTGKVWNNGQLVHMDHIKDALKYFNDITRDKAQRIVNEKIRIWI